MEGLATMYHNNMERVKEAREAMTPVPYKITTENSLKTMPPFPFPEIDEAPAGWELEETVTVYTAVFNAQHRPEVTVGQFLYKIKNEHLGKGFAILDSGDEIFEIGIFSEEEK